jgi:hypothetical protein
MFAFAGFFLKNLSTIWSQFFVSPYVVPASFTLLLGWSEIEEAPVISFYLVVGDGVATGAGVRFQVSITNSNS